MGEEDTYTMREQLSIMREQLSDVQVPLATDDEIVKALQEAMNRFAHQLGLEADGSSVWDA